MTPVAALIQSYVEEGIPDQIGPPWSPQTLETAISKGPNTSSCTPEMATFIQGEIQRSTKDGFIIILLATDSLQIFGEKLKLSRIAEVPQAHHCQCLILNLPKKTDEGTPSVNDTTNREAATELLQFRRGSPPHTSGGLGV